MHDRPLAATRRSGDGWSEGPDAKTAASLELRYPAPGRLELAGEVGGHQVRALLAREEPRFRLLDREIHWIREGPAQ